MATRRQGLALMTALSVLIGTLVVLQLWLLSISVEAWQAHHEDVLTPAAIFSAILFALNLGLVAYVFRFDHQLDRTEHERG